MSSIPHKDIHAAATNPSERGFPTQGAAQPSEEDAYEAKNNPATKTPAEKQGQHGQQEDESTASIDDRGAGSSGGAMGQGGKEGSEGVNKHLGKEEWEEQEGRLGQGGGDAPAALSGGPEDPSA